jgi:hypothetical protein
MYVGVICGVDADADATEPAMLAASSAVGVAEPPFFLFFFLCFPPSELSDLFLGLPGVESLSWEVEAWKAGGPLPD